MEIGNVHGTGIKQRIDNFKDRILEFDPRTGEHLWAVFGTWKVNPKVWLSGELGHLDAENLLSIVGPGCYYCELPYNELLAKRRCKGKP